MQMYFAKSILESKVFWANVAALALGVLEIQEIADLIPPDKLLYLTAVLNILLRFRTVRPVAFVAPGSTKPVAVSKRAT